MADENSQILGEAINDLFAEDPEKYKDVELFVSTVRQRLGSPDHFTNAKLLRPNGQNAVNGELVRFRGMIQNTHNPELFAPVYIAELESGEEMKISSCFRDMFDSHQSNTFINLDEGYATRMVYNVCSIPGETPWMAQRSVGSPQTNLSADYDEDKPYENLLTIRVYKEDELKINSIVEFYGVYFGRADIGDSGLTPAIFSCPNIHVIDYRVLGISDLVYRPLAMMNEPLMYLRQYAEILMGSKLAAQYLLTALAAKTYSWKEDHAIPMCTVPVAFTNVKDSRSIIESIRMLMPMVQVITVTKETLLGKMFISVNDNDTMRLDGGPMQLVNGSVLVLDFTKYDLPDSMNSSNRIAHINWQSIQRIVCEQRLMIDYGVSVHFVHTDLRVIALVPPKRETLIPFKFPAVVPLKVAYSDGLDPAVHELGKLNQTALSSLRWFLLQARDQVEQISLTHDVQVGITGYFTKIRERQGAGAADHFRHLLNLTRIQTALQGQHEMQLETFEKLLESENDRLTLISLLSLA